MERCGLGACHPSCAELPSALRREEARAAGGPGHLVSELCDWNSLSLTRWHFFSLSLSLLGSGIRRCILWAGLELRAAREGGVGPQAAWMVPGAFRACWSR